LLVGTCQDEGYGQPALTREPASDAGLTGTTPARPALTPERRWGSDAAFMAAV